MPWKKQSFWLDPWSYRNLLRTVMMLKLRNEEEGGRERDNGKGPQPVNVSVAMRYILRNLRFPADLDDRIKARRKEMQEVKGQ